MKFSRFLIVLAFILCAGCVHVISDESMQLVDPSLSFALLRESPDLYAGKYLLLGGAIASVSNIKQMGQLEVVQFQLDNDNMPVESNKSGGRFLARTDGFLDPFIYKTGRLVSIVGEIKGHKTMPLDQVEYDYPIIAIREIFLLRQEYARPYPSPYYYSCHPFCYDYLWRPYGQWCPWR